MSGKLIVFEGVEGCGKSTQLQRSHEWLVSSGLAGAVPITTSREPGGTHLGTNLRKLLLNANLPPLHERTELLLYAADRTQHVEEVLKPQLATGAIVLCDRFTESTIAYQGYGRGLALDLIDRLNQLATGGLRSDLTLWLDVDVDTGLARAGRRSAADRIEQAEISFHQQVQQGYKDLAHIYPDRIVRVDASQGVTEVQAQIRKILRERLAGSLVAIAE